MKKSIPTESTLENLFLGTDTGHTQLVKIVLETRFASSKQHTYYKMQSRLAFLGHDSRNHLRRVIVENSTTTRRNKRPLSSSSSSLSSSSCWQTTSVAKQEPLQKVSGVSASRGYVHSTLSTNRTTRSMSSSSSSSSSSNAFTCTTTRRSSRSSPSSSWCRYHSSDNTPPTSRNRPLHTTSSVSKPPPSSEVLATTMDAIDEDDHDNDDIIIEEEMDRLGFGIDNDTTTWVHKAPPASDLWDTHESQKEEEEPSLLEQLNQSNHYNNIKDQDDDFNEPSLLDQMNPTENLDFDADGEETLQEQEEQYVWQKMFPHHRQAEKRCAHEILLKFDKEDTKPDSDNLADLQLWLECQSQRESEEKYAKVIEDARQRQDYGSMNVVQRHILHWYQPLKDRIEQQQRNFLYLDTGVQHDTGTLMDDFELSKTGLRKYGPYLCSLQPQKLAVITAHTVLMDCLTNQKPELQSLRGVAIRLASAIEAEVNIQRAMKQQMDNAPLEWKQQMIAEREEAHMAATEAGKNNTKENLVQGSTSLTESNIFDSWMYGPSHLNRFIEDANKGIYSGNNNKKRMMRIEKANARARAILENEAEWDSATKTMLGVFLLNQLLSTGTIQYPAHRRVHQKEEVPAFEYSKKFNTLTRKRLGTFTLHDDMHNMVKDEKYESIKPFSNRHKPMILPPRDWVSPDDGAYSWLKAEFMRTRGCQTQKEALDLTDLTTAFAGLNSLGRVPWVINKKILEVAEHCWANNIPLGDIPPQTDYDVPLPPETSPDKFPPNMRELKTTNPELHAKYIDEFEEYRTMIQKRERLLQRNMDLRSLRCSAILKLEEARQFKDFEAIYYPYNMDFRGRAYPIPPYLSNIGSDLCRGLLTFAEAKPLGPRGLYWLKVHLANLGGNDKITFDQRAQFTDDNMENVRMAVTHPFGKNPELKETQWWMKLDDPFQGLAACHEIVNAIDSGDPESYMCSMPVHMDGSCNGLQHYAALGLDTVGGAAVNLCNSDKPSDVYIGVMEEVIRLVAEEAEKDLGFDTSDPEKFTTEEMKAFKSNRSAKLVNGLIDRGVVKRTVMTSVYGVTFIGAKEQIREKITEKLEERGHDIDEIDDEIFQACSYLAKITMDVMGQLFVGARQTMNWLTTSARLISAYEQPVAWISPIGVPCVQPYRQQRSYMVTTFLQKVTLVDNSDDLPVHKSRQVSAFPPNYVHSLDSSHMLLTALEMEKRGLTFSAVHDSFWTHACDVDEMNEALRECFVDLYKQPLLENLKAGWEMRYPDIEFPDIPERGDLDLDEVKSAPYFFQ